MKIRAWGFYSLTSGNTDEILTTANSIHKASQARLFVGSATISEKNKRSI